MAALPTNCPSCRGEVTVSRLKCDACGTTLEGTFEIPALLKLAPDDLEFVVRFVKQSGSLKAMAKEYGLSYPTIRNRLDDIIRKLGDADSVASAERHSILDAIAKGTLSVDAAERRLKGLAT
jgi:hypothetical protein